ncbi:MAG: hypothetical protein KDJ35_07550 [Alphaproteobacteria bacterium]|nr:hypothetical protein [Alphaproteobacteria bacterium]
MGNDDSSKEKKPLSQEWLSAQSIFPEIIDKLLKQDYLLEENSDDKAYDEAFTEAFNAITALPPQQKKEVLKHPDTFNKFLKVVAIEPKPYDGKELPYAAGNYIEQVGDLVFDHLDEKEQIEQMKRVEVAAHLLHVRNNDRRNKVIDLIVKNDNADIISNILNFEYNNPKILPFGDFKDCHLLAEFIAYEAPGKFLHLLKHLDQEDQMNLIEKCQDALFENAWAKDDLSLLNQIVEHFETPDKKDRILTLTTEQAVKYLKGKYWKLYTDSPFATFPEKYDYPHFKTPEDRKAVEEDCLKIVSFITSLENSEHRARMLEHAPLMLHLAEHYPDIDALELIGDIENPETRLSILEKSDVWAVISLFALRRGFRRNFSDEEKKQFEDKLIAFVESFEISSHRARLLKIRDPFLKERPNLHPLNLNRGSFVDTLLVGRFASNRALDLILNIEDSKDKADILFASDGLMLRELSSKEKFQEFVDSLDEADQKRIFYHTPFIKAITLWYSFKDIDASSFIQKYRSQWGDTDLPELPRAPLPPLPKLTDYNPGFFFEG